MIMVIVTDSVVNQIISTYELIRYLYFNYFNYFNYFTLKYR